MEFAAHLGKKAFEPVKGGERRRAHCGSLQNFAPSPYHLRSLLLLNCFRLLAAQRMQQWAAFL